MHIQYVFCEVGTDLIMPCCGLEIPANRWTTCSGSFAWAACRSRTVALYCLDHLRFQGVISEIRYSPVLHLQCVPVYSAHSPTRQPCLSKAIARPHLISLYDSDGYNYCHMPRPLSQSFSRIKLIGFPLSCTAHISCHRGFHSDNASSNSGQGCTNFLQSLGTTSKFYTPDWWRKANFILRAPQNILCTPVSD
jgi:hypothetical protein